MEEEFPAELRRNCVQASLADFWTTATSISKVIANGMQDELCCKHPSGLKRVIASAITRESVRT